MRAKRSNLNNNKPPAIVLGMTATGLSAARSLGRKGITVYGIDSKNNLPGMVSRFVNGIVMPSPIEDEAGFISSLMTFGGLFEEPAVILCAADEYLTALSRNRETLAKFFRFNIPSKEITEAFLDKKKGYELAARHGIECPSTYSVTGVEEILELKGKIKFPCAIKPSISHLWSKKFGGMKLIPARSMDELITAYSGIKNDFSEVMIQELIPGGDDEIYAFCAYLNKESKPLANFTKKKLRQYPIHFGISSFGMSRSDEKLKERGLDFLTKLRYTGMAAIEFKRDERDGRLKFMEMNMRLLMSGEMAIVNGVDFPFIVYRDAIGEKVDNISSFKEDIRLINLELDIGSFWQYRRAGEMTLPQYLRSFKGGKIAHTYFAWDDLIPGLFVARRFIKARFKHRHSRGSGNRDKVIVRREANHVIASEAKQSQP